MINNVRLKHPCFVGSLGILGGGVGVYVSANGDFTSDFTNDFF